MQNKGIVKFIAVLLILVCCFYLSFSFVTRHYESKAAAMGEEAGAEYLDSIKNEKVYMGIYSLKQCREMEIGLGLDRYERNPRGICTRCSRRARRPQDRRYLQEGYGTCQEGRGDQPERFHLSVREVLETRGRRTSPRCHLCYSADEGQGEHTVNVVRNRIDKFGVAQPNIQKLEGQSGRIMVEMPGIKEPERVRKLLQGSANLEFWETYNSNEITPLLAQLNQRYAITGGDAAPVDTAAVAEEAAPADTAAATTGDLAAKLAKKDDKADSKAVEAAKKQNPLFSIFQPTQGNTLAIVGYANARDTAEINKIIFSDLARQIMPAELKLRWGAKAEDFGGQNTKGDIFELYALKITEPSGRAPLEGDVITNAKDDFDQMGHPSVSMQMNSDGARRWKPSCSTMPFTLLHVSSLRSMAVTLRLPVTSPSRTPRTLPTH